MSEQKQNIVKTTITYNSDSVTFYIKSNRNTEYMERQIYLNNDGFSYYYTHNNHRSRTTWLKYKRLFDQAFETLDDNIDPELVHEHILEAFDEMQVQIDKDAINQIRHYIEDHPLENWEDLEVYADEIIQRFI